MNEFHAAALALVLASPALAQEPTSEEPPQGPPWTKDFFAAREQALATGKPIFLYSTKTH